MKSDSLRRTMCKLICIAIMLGLSACQTKNNSPINNQSVFVRADLDKNGLDIDLNLLSIIEAEVGKESEPLEREVWKYNAAGEEENYTLDTGVVFKFVSQEKARLIFENYHGKVLESGNYLFLTNMDFDKSYNQYYDIVIINSSDPFDVISLIGTHGINYDVYNDDVVEKLRQWDSKLGFTFEVIDGARIHALMEKLPEDLIGFTEDVYEFCPDVIEQGYGSMDEMIADYKQNKYFWLWWD